MRRIIKPEYSQPTPPVPEERNYREMLEEHKKIAELPISYEDPGLKAALELLLNIQPGKINYSQQEAADALNMSYQFVNRGCKRGHINTVSYGDRKLITVYELARIINQGVNNVN